MSLLQAGEGFVQSLTKNLSTSYGEIAEEIAKGYGKEITKAEALLNKQFNGDEALKKRAQKLLNEHKDVAFAKEMQKTMKSNISDKAKFDWIRQQQVEKRGALLGNAAFAGQVAKAYMFQDGKKAARIGTYAAGAVGLRVISGGTLTHNNTGERDIAGIPFI